MGALLFHRIIMRQMRREPGRALLSILGVALGVAVMLAIQLANTGSLRGFQRALDAVSGKAALEITAPPLGIDEKLIADLAWLREFGIVAPVIEADVIAMAPQRREVLRVIGIDALRDPALRDYAVNSGDRAGDGEAAGGVLDGMALIKWLSDSNAILVTRTFAERWKLKPGDRLKILAGDQESECRISGVIAGGSEGAGSLADQPLAVMDIAHAQVMLGRPGRIDRLEVRLHDNTEIADVEQKVRARLPVGLTVQRPERRSQAVEKMLAAFHFNLSMLSGIALVVGVFLIYNTVAVAVMTRRPEIGMLRTLGVTRSRVLVLFWGEALVLGIVGSVIGVPVARWLAQSVIALTATTVDTLYIATAATVPPLTWQHWLIGFGIALPLSLMAAALPAMEATRVPPVEAMRNRSAGGFTQSGAGDSRLAVWARRWLRSVIACGCIIAGLIAARQPSVGGLPVWGYFVCICAIVAMAAMTAPLLAGVARVIRPLLGRLVGIEGRLAASQVAASSQRLSVSVAALAVSLALTIAIAVMVGSFRQTILYWVDQTLGADLYVRPGSPARNQAPPPLSGAVLNVLREHPEVQVVDPYRSMDMMIGDRLVKLGAADFDTLIAYGRLALKTRGDAKAILAAAKAENQILVSESFALRFGVGDGDTVTLGTAAGMKPFRVAARFYDYSNDTGTITMDWSLFEKSFGAAPPTHAAVHLKPGAQADQARHDLMQQLNGKAFVTIFTNAGLRAEVLRIFDSTFAITWALEVIAVLVAMAGVSATMMTLLLERRHELRLLRIAGADARQVRRTIMIESGLIGAISQALGLAVGMVLSLVLIHVINPQSFGWSLQLHAPWTFLISATVLTISATVAAGFYPAWQATRQPLASPSE